MGDRTAEQITADDALTAAIGQAMVAYDFDAGIITDYLVTVAAQNFDDDGRMTTVYGNIYRESALPHYRVLGLLRCATRMAERAFDTEEDIS